MPIDQRERFREALELVLKAWTSRENFAWNGKHYQLGIVNLWPRPIQQPHPPMWIPGSGISATADMFVEHDYCFCHLSYFGAKNAEAVTDRYWDRAVRQGRDDNPYRLRFLQLIGVAETDAEAEDLYAAHAEYFFQQLLDPPQHYLAVPGCLEYGGLVQSSEKQSARPGESAESSRPRISTSAAMWSSARRRPCASNCSTASRNCAWGICWRCCISAQCRPHCASAVTVDVAYGGMFYVIANAAAFGLRIVPEEAREIVRIAELIKAAAREQLPVVHPENAGIAGVSIAQMSLGQKNAVVVSTRNGSGVLDRSPCGTGTCARMATLHAKGKLALHQDFVHEGILGTKFTGRLVEATRVGPYSAVVPTISGQAWITGIAQYVLDPEDPFPEGFTVADIW